MRDRLRVELRALQQKLQVTTIYVTHDQSEAMSLSDRIVFMSGGGSSKSGRPRRFIAGRGCVRQPEFLALPT